MDFYLFTNYKILLFFFCIILFLLCANFREFQFLTKDQAIVEAGCSVFYRISDPVRYISNVKDPELKGLKILVNAITIKRLEASDEREFQPTRKTIIEERILKELNSITSPWGIEISSAHMYYIYY
jgi:regulator of protease activity HflC (stomatin/prohibitin superfamily)